MLGEALLQGIFFGVVGSIAAIILSPVQFLKIMRQELGESYTHIISHYLSKGGVRIFFRGTLPYAMMNFMSSLAFGLSEYLYYYIFKSLIQNIPFIILIRSTIGGFIETVLSIYSEVQEIERNKGELIVTKSSISVQFLPILLRNSFFWCSTVLTVLIVEIYKLSFLNGIFLGMLLGMIFSFITLPFDVIATNICGASHHANLLSRFKFILKEKSIYALFTGFWMRSIQISCYTAFTVLSVMLIDFIFHRY
ncbi:MAG: putative membrane protein [Candidatus Xenolissoclinum pacificiensis L6]|uniref:Membrane protein n=1 Tax=Candidatus Xenolissoclinum pacificiensis L6 TaxID=1401685 RepID=W2V1G9_9RICK|nr:MAG: putative membrane protein [Candidatus Xenolissoclinum pacificiensis L6]